MTVNTRLRANPLFPLFSVVIVAIITVAVFTITFAWSAAKEPPGKGASARQSAKEPTGKEPASLDALAIEAARTLKTQLGQKKLYVDKAFIRDGITGETSNLSSLLRNELDAALSQNGFHLVDDIKDADYFVTISYQKDKRNLRVFIKYRKTGSEGGYKSISLSLRLEYLPQDTFTENLDSKIKKLSARLTQNLRGQKIFMSPVVEANYRYASDFSRYVTSCVRGAITSSGQADVLEEKPIMQSMKDTRSLKVQTGKVTRLETSDAVLSGADAYFQGFYAPDSKNVHVSLTLKDLQGKVLASADERIDRSLVTMNLENPEAKGLAEKADTAHESQERMIKISTSKGDKYQVFYTKEEVQFHVMVAKPLYVYIYNINAKGEVNLLYPSTQEAGKPQQAKVLYTIPSANDGWSIIVEPPYGTELVKAFACERDLKLPRIDGATASRSFTGNSRSLVRREKIQEELSTQININQDDLVDYYRGAAKAAEAPLYEDTLFLQTKGK